MKFVGQKDMAKRLVVHTISQKMFLRVHAKNLSYALKKFPIAHKGNENHRKMMFLGHRRNADKICGNGKTVWRDNPGGDPQNMH